MERERPPDRLKQQAFPMFNVRQEGVVRKGEIHSEVNRLCVRR